MVYYLIFGISCLITIGAQAYLNSNYKRCEKILTKKGITGKEVARKILDHNKLKDVKVEEVAGVLSDHYDPKAKVVRLSKPIYSNSSVASVSVAAHECGHAIQDKDGYFFLRFRHSIIPIVNLATKAGYVAIVAGLILGALQLFWIGIICEFLILFFQLITLPVEFNASSRGLNQLLELKIVEKEELSDCRGMLTAAALTYVSAVAASLLEIFRLLLMARRD